MAPIYAHALLRIEVCGGAGDERQCKPGVDDITNDGGAGSIDVGCTPGATQCTAKDAVIQLNNKSPLPTPPGWAAPVPPSVEPTPPSSATALPFVGPDIPPVPNATSAAIEQCRISSPGDKYIVSGVQYHVLCNNPACGGAQSPPAGYGGFQVCGGGTHFAYVSTTTALCPPGYNNVGGSCLLANAALVQKPSDGKCTVKRDGNSFSGDTRDPDCTVPTGINITPSSVTINPVSGSVENKKIEFMPDGSGKITSNKPNADGTTTERSVTFGSPDPATGDSKVTGTGERTFRGTGDQKGEAIGELPTDYNRETTQQGIKGVLDSIKDALGVTGMPDGSTALDGAKDAHDTAAADRESSLGDVISATGKDTGWGFTFAIPTAECVPIEITEEIEVDICTPAAKLREFLAFIWFLGTAWICLGMVGHTIRSA